MKEGDDRTRVVDALRGLLEADAAAGELKPLHTSGRTVSAYGV